MVPATGGRSIGETALPMETGDPTIGLRIHVRGSVALTGEQESRWRNLVRHGLELRTEDGWSKARSRLGVRRAKFAMDFYRISGGRYAGVVPRGTTCSIPEIMGDADSCPNVVRFRSVLPASVETYRIPAGLPPAFRSEHAFATRNVYRMRDVIVGIPTGVCLSKEHIFLESYGNAFRWFDCNPTGARPWELSEYPLVKPLPVEGPVTCLGAAPYGHVLIQEIPRLLHALEENSELSVVTRLDAPRYMSDLLHLLQRKNVIKGRVVGLAKGLYHVADYTFTSDEEDSGFFRSESVRMLRKYLGEDVAARRPLATPTPNRVYVSRRRSDRSFTNEAEIEAMLSQKGFAIVFTQDLDMADEIALFQQADTIVAPHGAGLTNLVWIKPGTRVVEILSPGMISDFFVRLADVVQADHTLCWARPDDGWGSVDLEALDVMVEGPGVR
jgi:hypothetical protein